MWQKRPGTHLRGFGANLGREYACEPGSREGVTDPPAFGRRVNVERPK